MTEKMKQGILYLLIVFVCYSCYDELDKETCIMNNAVSYTHLTLPTNSLV